MTWLLWRQHRVQFSLAAGLLALFAIPVVVTGRSLADALKSCRADNSCSGFDLLQNYNAMQVLASLTVVVPLVIGVFWGATIVGKELDNGTATLVWTQSVTRGRWLRAKLLTLFVSTLLVSGAVTALVTWWSNPRNSTVESRFGGLEFDIQGITPVGYSLFAAALGLAAGVLWRRMLPAMATTLGGFLAVRIVVEVFARQHFRTPVTQTTLMTARGEVPPGSWVLSTDLVQHGHVINGPVRVSNNCGAAGSRDGADSCMNALGYRFRTIYQPAGRYWSFQFIETGIFVALAVALVAVTVVVMRRHDA
jgi:hypothetical protein